MIASVPKKTGGHAMKFYDSPFAPNARRVRIFLAEKGLTLPTVQVDLGKLEHKSDAFRSLNIKQRVPVLELDDGTHIAESIAICRYLEHLHPEPNLFGKDAKEEARIEMWQRQIEFDLLFAIGFVFRHSHPAMAQMEVPQVKEWAEACRPKALRELAFLDSELKDRPYIAGDRFTIADITAFVCVDFMKPARLTMPEGLTHFRAWAERIAARPGSVK